MSAHCLHLITDDVAEASRKRQLVQDDDFPQWPEALGEAEPQDLPPFEREQQFLRDQVLHLQQLMNQASRLKVAQGSPFMIIEKSVLVNVLDDAKQIRVSLRFVIQEQVARPVCRTLTSAALRAAPTTSAALPTGLSRSESKKEQFRVCILPAQLDVSLGRFERATFRSVVSEPSSMIYSFFHSAIIDLVGDYLY